MCHAGQTTLVRKFLILLIIFMAMPWMGCGSESGEQPATPVNQKSVPTPPTTSSSEDMSWFMRGGSLNKASTLEAWRMADTKERLASAADLLSMKVRNLPAPKEAANMARALEAKITAAAEAGEQGLLGPVVDRIVSEMKW